MKTFKQTFLLLIITLFISCSSDDSNEVSAPDDLHPSEWSNTVGGLTYTMYFSIDIVDFSHPIGQEIEGHYTYNKPNVEFHFTGACNNSGFVFSSCDVSGSINGDTLTITDNGEDFEFYRKYD